MNVRSEARRRDHRASLAARNQAETKRAGLEAKIERYSFG